MSCRFLFLLLIATIASFTASKSNAQSSHNRPISIAGRVVYSCTFTEVRLDGVVADTKRDILPQVGQIINIELDFTDKTYVFNGYKNKFTLSSNMVMLSGGTYNDIVQHKLSLWPLLFLVSNGEISESSRMFRDNLSKDYAGTLRVKKQCRLLDNI